MRVHKAVVCHRFLIGRQAGSIPAIRARRK
nr:MAG TPA: hypothetical protein [Caudoviricetes sp.]DAW23422.1 MAG TPA: hypothetical protein [Caudoviricetes sp.]